jgi:hypothetical protein
LLSELDDIAREEASDPGKRERDAVVSVRIYPTRRQSAQHLAITLQNLVAEDTWGGRGGKGEIYPLDGLLVVRQTAAVHRSIGQLLAQVDRQRESAPASEEAGPPPGPAAGKPDDPFGVLSVPPASRSGRTRHDLPGKNPLKR